jgi:hypothetical protein
MAILQEYDLEFLENHKIKIKETTEIGGVGVGETGRKKIFFRWMIFPNLA